MSRHRVLLADDHRIFLDGLERLLQPEYEIVGKASDGGMLVDLAKDLDPDLIVTDYSMPDLTGVQALSALRRASVRSKVVILTMHEDAEYATEAIEHGVNGYVLKRQASSDLLTALREALEGNTWISPMIATQLEQRGERSGALGRSEQQLLSELSPRQRGILARVVQGKIAKEIANDLELSRKSVEYHKYKMMKHLGVSSSAELIRFALRNGLEDE